MTVSVCGGFVPNCDTEIVNVSAGRASNYTAGNGSLVDTEPVMLQPHNIAIVIRSYSSPYAIDHTLHLKKTFIYIL